MNDRLSRLREKAAALPLCPGVYLMKDSAGRVIYVGKSRRLRNRVSSYFIGEHNRKTERMVASVADFDTILCDSEMEALSLENVLIKQYTPHYNIKLKDAKSYPYIRVTPGDYPRLLVTRDRRAPGGRYFGPYPGTAAAYAARDALNRVFRLPTCHRVFPRDIGRERPCLYAQMGRCLAPCTGDVSREEYARTVRAASEVLGGNIRATVAELSDRMASLAAEERFEEAARVRDAVAALRQLTEKQTVVADADVSQDVYALYSDDVCGVLARLSVREGQLCRKNEFLFAAAEVPEGDAVTAFLYDLYREGEAPPREVLLAFPLEDEERETLEAALRAECGRRVTVRTPQRGAGHKLCAMALANARERAARYRADCVREDSTLAALCRLLGLEVLPDRIEAYDISNIGAEHITGAMVVYAGGGMKKSDYRTFRVASGDGPDDYGAMREVLSRRLSHIGDGSPSLGERPDLILLDGGAAHVHVGRAVLEETGHADIPLFGMVKDDFHRTRALTDGENEVSFSGQNAVYAMVYQIQEEVHRVAVSHTMGAKRRTLRHSSLEKIPGIGPVKAEKLRAAFPGMARLKAATQEDIAAVRGLTAADAAAVWHYYHKDENEQTEDEP